MKREFEKKVAEEVNRCKKEINWRWI